MNNDMDLQNLWQQGQNWQTNIHGSQLVDELKAELNKMYSSIKSRNRNEMMAAAFVIIAFAAIGCFMENALAQWGAWLVSAAALWIFFVMAWIARQQPQQKADRPFKEQLGQEIQYFQKEKQLLSRVIWWYILPIFTGLTLYFLGFRENWATFGISMAAGILLIIYIIKMNRDTVREKIDPLLQKLKALEQELES